MSASLFSRSVSAWWVGVRGVVGGGSAGWVGVTGVVGGRRVRSVENFC